MTSNKWSRLLITLLFIAYATTFNYGGCGGGGGKKSSAAPTPAPAPVATKLGFIQQPTNATTNSTINPAITVAIQDAYGNTMSSATNAVTIAIANNPGGGTLSGTLTKNAVNGIVTFNNLSINKIGLGYTLQVTSTGLTAATSNAFNITPTIALSRSTVEFSILEGQVEMPPTQIVSVYADGAVNWSGYTPSQNWVSVHGFSQSILIGDSVTSTLYINLTSNASSLVSDTYTATMQINAPSAANAPITLTIKVTVTSPPATMPKIGVSTNILNFTCNTSTSPATQNLIISNLGGGTLRWEAETSSNWISLSAYQDNAPATIQVSLDQSEYGYPVGTYKGWIKVWGINLTTEEIPLVNPVIVEINITVTGSVTVPPGRDWTIMVYMNADNNLESEAIADINEMEAITSTYNTNEVAVIVLVDRHDQYDTSNGDWKGCRAYLIQKDSNPTLIGSTQLTEQGELNMGSPDSLAGFMDYCATNYPATNYGLVIWNHGAGFQCVGADENNGSGGKDWLTGPELRQAISSSVITPTLVIFDECLDANFELFYEIADLTNFIVASEETMPGFGGNYTPWLDYLVSNTSAVSTVEPLVLAQKFAVEYMKQPNDEDMTISLIDTEIVSDYLKAYLNILGTYLATNINSVYDYVTSAKNTTEKFHDPYPYKDLGDFSYLLYYYGTGNATLQTHAANVYNSVRYSVFYRDSKKGHPYAMGIQGTIPDVNTSAWQGVTFTNLANAYATTRYDIGGGTWWDFINAYKNAVKADVTDPIITVTQQPSQPISINSPGEFAFQVTETSLFESTLYVAELQGLYYVFHDYKETAPDWVYRIIGPSVLPNCSTNAITETWDTTASAVINENYIVFTFAEYDNPVKPNVATVKATLNDTDPILLKFDVETGMLIGCYNDEYDEPIGEITLITGDEITIKTLAINLAIPEYGYYDVYTITYDESFGLWFGWEKLPDGEYSVFLSVEDAWGNSDISDLISVDVLNE